MPAQSSLNPGFTDSVSISIVYTHTTNYIYICMAILKSSNLRRVRGGGGRSLYIYSHIYILTYILSMSLLYEGMPGRSCLASKGSWKNWNFCMLISFLTGLLGAPESWASGVNQPPNLDCDPPALFAYACESNRPDSRSLQQIRFFEAYSLISVAALLIEEMKKLRMSYKCRYI